VNVFGDHTKGFYLVASKSKRKLNLKKDKLSKHSLMLLWLFETIAKIPWPVNSEHSEWLLVLMNLNFFPAKSLPLHCVVESVPSLQASFQLDSRSPWRRRPNIETDSYVIIPAATPFCDIVTIALQRLGYSSDISNTAKGKSHVTRCAMHLIWLIFLHLIHRGDNNQKLEAASTR
jgi:hypothetical protein